MHPMNKLARGVLSVRIAYAVPAIVSALCTFTAVLQPGHAIAQSMTLDMPNAEDVLLHDTGWALLLQTRELLLFLLDFVVTVLLTAAIAYHPMAKASRTSIGDLELPVLLFVYGIIGMTVGFLVIHHGYLIGFVIFGIGGLLRFRTSGESPRETMRMILVTVIGLCVGLDVPPIAIFISAVAWIVLYVLGRTENHSLEIKFTDDRKLLDGISAVREILGRFGAKVVAENRARFKSTVEFVFTVNHDVGIDAISSELEVLRSKKAGPIADWHLH